MLAVIGCGESVTGPGADEITQLPRALTAAEGEIIGASNRFTFDLLGQASRPGENFFLSPLSASMALGMTLNGAAGETWNQMRGVLGFGNLTQEEINASYESLIDLLVGLDPAVETAIGNSVWTRQGFRCMRTSWTPCEKPLAPRSRNSISRTLQRPRGSTSGSRPRQTVASRTSSPR